MLEKRCVLFKLLEHKVSWLRWVSANYCVNASLVSNSVCVCMSLRTYIRTHIHSLYPSIHFFTIWFIITFIWLAVNILWLSNVLALSLLFSSLVKLTCFVIDNQKPTKHGFYCFCWVYIRLHSNNIYVIIFFHTSTDNR